MTNTTLFFRNPSSISINYRLQNEYLGKLLPLLLNQLIFIQWRVYCTLNITWFSWSTKLSRFQASTISHTIWHQQCKVVKLVVIFLWISHNYLRRADAMSEWAHGITLITQTFKMKYVVETITTTFRIAGTHRMCSMGSEYSNMFGGSYNFNAWWPHWQHCWSLTIYRLVFGHDIL